MDANELAGEPDQTIGNLEDGSGWTLYTAIQTMALVGARPTFLDVRHAQLDGVYDGVAQIRATREPARGGLSRTQSYSFFAERGRPA